MTKDFMTQWREQELRRQESVRTTKTALMPILRDLGITYVLISYNGYGDSGQVEDIAVYGSERTDAPEETYDNKGQIDLPDVVVTLPEQAGEKLKDFLDEYGWRVAYDANPGFENNEGGQGTVLIDVAAEKITVNHGNNYVEVHYSTHEVG